MIASPMAAAAMAHIELAKSGTFVATKIANQSVATSISVAKYLRSKFGYFTITSAYIASKKGSR